MKRLRAEVAAIQQQIDEQMRCSQDAAPASSKRRSSKPRLSSPTSSATRYRRIVGRYGADALAACENASCLGCYTSLTPQMINDLINGEGLSFCLSCGRLLYLTEPEIANTRRSSAAR